MTSPNILIVEDEARIAEVLIAYCQKEGYQTRHETTGKNAVQLIKDNNFDLVLLDLMLSDTDGLTICTQVRAFSDIPIIMVTAKSEEVDRLLGLELGADDYICKPFSPREVIARIKAILRRINKSDIKSESKTGHKQELNIIKESGFEVERDNYKAKINNQLIDFTPIEFKIFELFISNVERVFSRNDILKNIYDDNADVSDRNIDTHIKNIRKKINAIQDDINPITSVYGVGYRFESLG